MTESTQPTVVDQEQQELFDNPDRDRVNYDILDGYRRPNGHELSGEEVREWYVHLTDELIQRMEGDELHPKPDYVIFLDKSARPVAWLVKELWPILAREPGTEFDEDQIPAMPQMKFLNIDREQWQATVGDYQSEGIDVSKIPQHMVDDLRAIFATKLVDEDSNANDTSTIFDGKNILVVDEVGVTGATLSIARGVIKRAFPDANIDGHHWMSPQIIETKGAKMNLDVPVWYQKATNLGRGINARDSAVSARSVSQNQRRGRYWLSTAHEKYEWDEASGEQKRVSMKEVDPLAYQLRQEFHQLAKDVVDGKIMVFPGVTRDDHVERAESINDVDYDVVRDNRFKPLG